MSKFENKGIINWQKIAADYNLSPEDFKLEVVFMHSVLMSLELEEQPPGAQHIQTIEFNKYDMQVTSELIPKKPKKKEPVVLH